MAWSNSVTKAFLKKKMKPMETSADCDLKAFRCRQLIEYMKVCEYVKVIMARSILHFYMRKCDSDGFFGNCCSV